MDMTESIAPKSDQMNAEDLLSGPRTFTITDIREGSPDQPVWVYLAEHPQPFKPSKTVRRLMVLAWGPDSSAHIGQRMTLYRDDTVRWAGKEIGGIRVSHMSGIGVKPLTTMLPRTRGSRDPYTVQPLPDVAPAAAAVPVDRPVHPLVAAFDAAGIGLAAARLEYCRGIVQRDLQGPGDLTEAEVTMVVEALAFDREKGE